MKIKVRGCVQNNDATHEMAPGSTIGQAIELAGGFGRNDMRPTGVISIRRKTNNGVEGLSFNYKTNPKDLDFELKDRDTIRVQFDVKDLGK